MDMLNSDMCLIYSTCISGTITAKVQEGFT